MKTIFLAWTALAGLSLISSAYGAAITVPNFSFEDNYYLGPENTQSGINDWLYSNLDGGAYYGTQANDNQFTNTGTAMNPQYGVFPGAQYAFMNMTDGGSATLTSASSLATIQAGMTYLLTVGIGNHLEPDDVDYGQPGNQSISLLANGVVIADPTATFTLPNGTLANGTNADYSVSFSATGADAVYVGQSLTVQLGDNAIGVGRPVQAAFDNVRLEATPEPGTWAMLLAGVGMLAFFHRRRLRA